MRIEPIRYSGDAVVDFDFTAAFTVMESHERGVSGSPSVTEAEARADLESPLVSREHSLLAWDGDQPVALLLTSIDQSSRDVYVEAYAIPEAPDQVLHDFVEVVKQHARALAASDASALRGWDLDAPLLPHSGVWQVVAHSHAADDRYSTILRSHGLEPIRRYWHMRVDITGSEEPPKHMEGLQLIVADDESLLRRLHAVHQDSFRDHFGFTFRRFEDWLALVEAAAGHDPARCHLVRWNEEDAGVLICDDSRAHEGVDYLRTLGVTKQHRGQGIATLLLRHVMAEASARGRTAVELHVDSDNTSGAVALYERVGMSPMNVVLAYRALA
jgi:mycothiol synthase